MKNFVSIPFLGITFEKHHIRRWFICLRSVDISNLTIPPCNRCKSDDGAASSKISMLGLASSPGRAGQTVWLIRLQADREKVPKRFIGKFFQCLQTLEPHRNTTLSHVIFSLSYCVFTIMENAGSKNSIGTTFLNPIGQMLEIPNTP